MKIYIRVFTLFFLPVKNLFYKILLNHIKNCIKFCHTKYMKSYEMLLNSINLMKIHMFEFNIEENDFMKTCVV